MNSLEPCEKWLRPSNFPTKRICARCHCARNAHDEAESDDITVPTSATALTDIGPDIEPAMGSINNPIVAVQEPNPYVAINPKEIAATRDDKPALDLLEYAADVEIAQALKHGADKYGRRNFRKVGSIKASVYIGAIKRHIGAYANGEHTDPDSGLSHLAHVGACIHVMFSAMDAGTFDDDRM